MLHELYHNKKKKRKKKRGREEGRKEGRRREGEILKVRNADGQRMERILRKLWSYIGYLFSFIIRNTRVGDNVSKNGETCCCLVSSCYIVAPISIFLSLLSHLIFVITQCSYDCITEN
jgi:hypothetical protein